MVSPGVSFVFPTTVCARKGGVLWLREFDSRVLNFFGFLYILRYQLTMFFTYSSLHVLSLFLFSSCFLNPRFFLSFASLLAWFLFGLLSLTVSFRFFFLAFKDRGRGVKMVGDGLAW